MSSEFRSLPSVDAVLSDRPVRRLVDEYSHGAVLGLVRARLDDARAAIADGGSAPGLDELVSGIVGDTASLWRAWPSQVVNATGVVLHTNLGRAPLSRAAVEAARQAAAGYSDLELDLETGRRGSRQAHVQRLLCQLTGAEAALVVNNNASALLIGLSAVAPGREVIVSRGEAIEIGGGFRIPDVMRQSGGTLVEVGTTNRTYVRDFEEAITENTGAILSAHASNFKVVGFTHSPTTEELAELGRRRGVPVLHDLGSGCLLDTTRFGLAREPMPQESVSAGVSLSFFSGDKLLGGPQAGIIVGDRGLVGMASRHPLARAMRIDKLSLASLSATLVHYVKGEAVEEIPTWRMIAEPVEALRERAAGWAASLGGGASVAEGLSTIGGGSLPGETLPTSLLRLDSGDATGLAARLRRGSPPVVARIEDDAVVLDPRTVMHEQDGALLAVARGCLAEE